jgi:hypothetical protein
VLHPPWKQQAHIKHEAQKFEQRFGPGNLPEEQRNRRDLTIEDARALKRYKEFTAAAGVAR